MNPRVGWGHNGGKISHTQMKTKEMFKNLLPRQFGHTKKSVTSVDQASWFSVDPGGGAQLWGVGH